MTLHKVEPKPNQAVIDMLEDLLEQAKKGEIQGLCVAGAMDSAATFNWFEMGGYTMALVGEMRILERDVIDCCVSLRADDVSEF